MELENLKIPRHVHDCKVRFISAAIVLHWKRKAQASSTRHFFLSLLDFKPTVPNCLCALLITDAGALGEKNKAQRAAGRLYKLLVRLKEGIKRGGEHPVVYIQLISQFVIS